MTYEEENERTERVLFGLPYRGTCAEARRLILDLHASGILDDVLKSPGAAAMTADQLLQTAQQSIEAYRAVVSRVAKLIEQMESLR